MRRDGEQLRRIYDRTCGKCHLCGEKLAFGNYGRPGSRGAWEIEHSVPRAVGGTDHGNNLYAAHVSCNCSKGARSTRAARWANDLRRAPLSTDARRTAKCWNAVGGALIGVLPGAALLGAPGLILGGLVGALVGHDQDPDKNDG